MGILDMWNKPSNSIKEMIEEAIQNNYDLSIKYRKFDGTLSSRIISDIEYNNAFEDEGFYNDHIKGFCNLRQEDRTFKIQRIIKAEIVK
ncbi:hypothetical protein [Mesoflavibacter zeaxanthinifaciens]|uniref:hypothetical protein n=1 Tax=Mesoflavibacter zeaxanthinifaciens TaxID=393060 RepID=UPI003A955FE5